MLDNNIKLANLRMLEFIATKLGDIRNDVVFLGRCTTGLFISDPLVPDVRYTLDVDCIVDVISLNQYHQLEKKLTQRGFKKSISEDVICRWFYDEVILDVMPTDEKILGFGNRWYKEAIAASTIYPLTDTIEIRVVTAPYFLATKFEAFRTRGKMDCYASHDFEDIVSILDGRNEIIDEINNSDIKLREYLVNSLQEVMSSSSFKGAIPGHFTQYGGAADDRIEFLEQKLTVLQSQ
ncbi:MAG: hypothetical protein QM652_08750 [Legionella sp.]|uniref:hypothetical protein n=1 Tax=Legionella sp. TaxID=459 RepID=UPI0039E6556E